MGKSTGHEAISHAPGGSAASPLPDRVALSLSRFWHDERGSTAIEYALIGAFIFLVLVSVLSSLGADLNTTFQKVDYGFHPT